MTKIQDIRSRTPFGNPTRNLSQIKYIVRHHSATTDGNFDSFIKHWQGSRGWITGGYHEIILRDGTVQLCYNPEQVTNGVANMNTVCYHICLVGNGSFTAAQEKAWDERVSYNMDRLGIDVNNVKGHGELQKTTCPGINMDTVRQRIRKSDTSKPSPSKPTSNKGIKWLGTNDKGKRIEAIVPSVNFYDTQRWTNPTGSFKKGEGWIVDNLYEVDGSEQYRVQNSKGDLYYITARPDLVRIVGDSTSSNPKKSIGQMANEVIAGKHGNGHTARRRSLGINNATYQKVRAEVNKRL